MGQLGLLIRIFFTTFHDVSDQQFSHNADGVFASQPSRRLGPTPISGPLAALTVATLAAVIRGHGRYLHQLRKDR